MRLGSAYLDLTWRELDDQFWGATFEEWKHTSAIIATMANQNVGKGKKSLSLEQVHPFIQQASRSKMMPMNWENLHSVFGVRLTEDDPWEKR